MKKSITIFCQDHQDLWTYPQSNAWNIIKMKNLAKLVTLQSKKKSITLESILWIERKWETHYNVAKIFFFLYFNFSKFKEKSLFLDVAIFKSINTFSIYATSNFFINKRNRTCGPFRYSVTRVDIEWLHSLKRYMKRRKMKKTP